MIVNTLGKGFLLIILLLGSIYSLQGQCESELEIEIDSSTYDIVPFDADSCTLELLYCVTNVGPCDLDTFFIDLIAQNAALEQQTLTSSDGPLATGDTQCFDIEFAAPIFSYMGTCYDTLEIKYELIVSDLMPPVPSTIFIDCPSGTGVLEVCANNNGIPCPTSGAAGCVMPINMDYFEGRMDHYSAVLEWGTWTELNNEMFVVEHCLDGQSFQKIGTLDGSGTSYDRQEYEFVHSNPGFGFNYYRIYQQDFDGSRSYSNILGLDFELKRDFQMSPNPVSDQLNVIWSLDRMSREIVITSTDGKVLYSKLLNEDQLKVDIDVSSFTPGLYFLHTQNGFRTKSERFIKI